MSMSMSNIIVGQAVNKNNLIMLYIEAWSDVSPFATYFQLKYEIYIHFVSMFYMYHSYIS